MEAIRSSETSVLTIATQHHIPEDGILQDLYVVCSTNVCYKMKIMTCQLKIETLKLRLYSPGGKFGGRLVATRKMYSNNSSTTASTRNGFMMRTVQPWLHTPTAAEVSCIGH
jgi:hypothetical protein